MLFRSIREFIALTKSKPGTMTYASAGNGSASHFVGELFKSLTGASLMHVPYKGAAPAMTDLLGGRLDAVFLGLSGVQQQTSVRILAVTNPERAPQIPNVPTVAEEVPEYRPKNFYAAWVGLHGPRALPPAVVAELNNLLEKGLTHADTRRQMIEVGSVPQYLGAAEFTKKIASEATGFAEMVKQFNIRAD